MSLLQDLSAWDKKSTHDIQAIYVNYSSSNSFVADIISLIVKGRQLTGATWLLKYYFEQGGRLSTREIHAIYSVLLNLDSWESRLHILQSIMYMPIQSNDFQGVENFVRKGLTDSNKFVRAWSYHGFYELARTFPDLQEEAQEIFDMALRDEAASVKARVRNILKAGF